MYAIRLSDSQGATVMMAMTRLAAVLAPYVERLLSNQDVHDHVRRAVGAARDVRWRARRKSPAEAVEDKKAQRLPFARGRAFAAGLLLGWLLGRR
jgi:ribosome biogenesis protein Tsr3